ncbi:HMG-box domain-containing protein [Chryseobacterium luteum]|uniref:Uncharacterized protein n=1 Tax=Chryseobacterium luteum TaxID=421531 RepID=A0A085ZWH7_9FLAO|nr:hypothetical protein [Chryseobacterium luteum]KFF08791.1 hypothetical protein IX38_05000 [Chryseobacterium luteum]
MKNLCIPNPCSENWETMSPQEKGRFCSVCNKCVIDFTQKQPQEIARIIDEKKDEEVCGRFYKHQLNKGVEQSERLKTQFFAFIPSYFQNNKITLAVFSLILFLAGCSKPKDTCTATTGLVTIEEDSNQSNNNYVMGEALIQNDSVAKVDKKDSSKLNHKK